MCDYSLDLVAESSRLGWWRGLSAGPGEFCHHPGWNAARVYEEAIAIIGRQIDEH
jgi:hypothetical protein